MSEFSERVRGLLGRMNLDEKCAQMTSIWLRFDSDGHYTVKDLQGFSVTDATTDCANEALVHGIGQITRPLGTHRIAARLAVRGLNGVQKFLKERTRLGIPALPHEECLAGLMAHGATLFPAGINYGAIWDADLVRRIGQAIGEEVYSVGGRQGLAPVLDVSRDVRWGRTEESLGEDPYLAGALATAYVQGLQGKDRRVLATLKHYAGHSFSEGGRNHAPVRIGERELNDTFLLPFEMAIALADAGSVMPAYHDIDGEPATSSYHLLTEILRNKWGFDGLVVSDYEAISLLYDHHKTATDKAEAAAATIRAGMDIELPGSSCFGTGIREAIEQRLLDMSDVDAAVLRILNAKEKLGLFDNPYVSEDAISLNTASHRAVAREAALSSITLLKNDGILPLGSPATVALIGPLADEKYGMLSGYSFPAHFRNHPSGNADSSSDAVTIRTVLSERLPGRRLLYHRGCKLLNPGTGPTAVFPGELESLKRPQIDPVNMDASEIGAAVETALQADLAVVVVGDIAGLFISGTVGEGSDVTSLKLPGVQQELLEAVVDTGKPVIVIVISGRPYNLGRVYSSANAVIEAWLPGQEGARAIGDILFGDEEPGGRLPVSIPKSAGAMPYFYNHKLKSSGTPIQKEFGSIFAFGHGIGYTTFEYAGFSAEAVSVPADGEIIITGAVRNVGKRQGDEVLQVYIRDRVARLVRPIKELKAFARMRIPADRSAAVRITIPTDMLSYSITPTDRIVEPGEFDIMVGSSSDDIHFQTSVMVQGPERTLERGWRMLSTLEWELQ